ncbi:PID1 isoform 6 [Pan troglodytes]|uniref:PTB-containing, cubilin and LRP1-interacting protein n=2 Tax=Pan troglodytes TaxID=9598 RepID=A0A2I3RPE0_PANTR|nr:PID1 isoform 6 [Pan troglodytes]
MFSLPLSLPLCEDTAFLPSKCCTSHKTIKQARTLIMIFLASRTHFQTMLKSKLNVLTLKKEPLPAVIFHEPEAIELCTTTPLMKTRTHSGCKVTYLGKVSTTGMQFLSGCTEKPVIELWKKHTLAREDVFPANALLEIRPFQVWLHHLDHKGEATVHMDTFQVARIAYCTADHNVSPNIFAWVYREINDDLSYQMDCHAVECESKLEAKKLAHAMMEAFRKTFHSMKSDGRIHSNSSSEEVSQELESDDG